MQEQIKELTLLLLYLTSWEEKDPYGECYNRAWKGYDFDILNELENDELISGSHKSKSTCMTEKGVDFAKNLMKKYKITQQRY